MKRKLPEVIVEEDVKKLLVAIKAKKYKLAVALGFYQCMRVSEVAKLKPENINKQLKLIMIKQAKGSKDRNIPIAPEVMNGLKHLPVGSNKAKDFGIRAIQIFFNRITLKVLGKSLNFHLLRHSGITHYLVKKRWSSLEVQRLAGHAKITTTEIYTHINPQNLVSRMWDE